MTNSRRRRGRNTEKMVADFLKENGWPYAEATSASAPGTDITGVLGVDIEVKARQGFPVKATMRQQSNRLKEGQIAVAVLRQNGSGEKDLESWPAVVTLETLILLLKKAGY